MNKKSIKYNAIMNGIVSVVNIIFPIITFPYVARVLSVEGLGIINFYSNIGTYACMLASLGIGTYGIRVCASKRDNKDELSRVVSELIILEIICSSIVIIFMLFLAAVMPALRANKNLLFFQMLLVVGNVGNINWFYSAIEEYSYITKRTLLFKVLYLILVFVFVRDESDFIVYSLISVATVLGNEICNLVYVKRYVSLPKYINNISYHLKPMMILFVAILAVSVYTTLDTIMLGFINGSKDVGYYTLAVKVKTILLTLVNALSAVLLPRLSFFVKKKRMNEYNILLSKSIEIIYMIALPLTLFFMIEASNTVLVLGGAEYKLSSIGMTILMPVLLISGFSNITGNQILIPHGKEKCFMIAVGTGAMVDIFLNVLLMPKYGFVGAAIATLVAELTQAGIQLSFSIPFLKGKIRKIELLCITISASLSSLIIIFLPLKEINNSMLQLLIAMIIFAISYIGFVKISRVSVFVEVETVIIKKMTNRERVNNNGGRL